VDVRTAAARITVPAVRALCGLLGLVGLLALACGACHHPPKPKPKVVTSIFPVYDLTRRVAGEDADVLLLPPVEVSPHRYEPAAGDMDRGAGANLAVMIGLDFDPWMQTLMTARGAPKSRVLKLADRVPTLPRRVSLTDEGTQAQRDAHRKPGAPDPRGDSGIDVHVWLDPQRALLMGRAITDELVRVDPDHAQGYRSRGLELTHAIEALDHELEGRTGKWKGRAFATLHDCFRYYAGRYHLDADVAVEAQPGVRPPLRYEQQVLGRMRSRGVVAIFGEPQLDSRPARLLGEAGPFNYGVLDPLGGTPGAMSYEELLRADTDSLEKALESPLPVRADGGSVSPPAPLAPPSASGSSSSVPAP